MIRLLATLITMLTLASQAFAVTAQKYIEDNSVGLGIIYIDNKQLDMNGAIDDANSLQGAALSHLGNAWEFYAQWTTLIQYSNLMLILRPSYYTQSTSSSNHLYRLTGTTIFPIVRSYFASSGSANFFIQAGVGYGELKGEINSWSTNMTFSGNGIGVLGGLGMDMCFNDRHCLNIEGNLRYLQIPRNTATGGNCVNSGDIPGITRCYTDYEVERNYSDLKTNMSGLQILVGYGYRY